MITDTYIISTGFIKFVYSIRQTFNITYTYIGTECMRIIGIQWNKQTYKKRNNGANKLVSDTTLDDLKRMPFSLRMEKE
jgi:hypothetical protein